MKTNQTIEPVIAEDFGSVQFVFRNLPAQTLDMSKLSEAVKSRAAVVGMAQVRIVDAAAIPREEPKTKRLRTDAEMEQLKWDGIADLIAHYETGTTEWSRVAQSAGPKGGYLFEALVEMFDGQKTPSEVREFIDGLSAKEQGALRDDDEVAPIIARIKAAKVARLPEAARVDTKNLLGSLKA